jgi:hypothetical protein
LAKVSRERQRWICSALEALIAQHNVQAACSSDLDDEPAVDEVISLKAFDPTMAGYESEDPFAESGGEAGARA